MCSQAIFAEKSQAPSVDQSWLQVLQFAMHLINLLSILLRYEDFTGTQKAVVNPTGSRPPNSDHDPIFWCKFGSWKCFEASQSNYWTDYHQLSYKIHFSSHVTMQSRKSLFLFHRIRKVISKWWFFLNLWLVHEGSTYQAFSPFQFASIAKKQ